MERTEAVTRRAEEFLKKLDGVQSVVTMGGLNILTSVFTSNNATIIVNLKPWSERTTPETRLRNIFLRTRREFSAYPEAIALIMPPAPIPGLGTAEDFSLSSRISLGSRQALSTKRRASSSPPPGSARNSPGSSRPSAPPCPR